jgi:ATP-dependent DNA helicase RecG
LPGKTLTDKPLDQAEISGDLLGLLRELDARILKGTQSRLVQISTLREKAIFEYPEVAIR